MIKIPKKYDEMRKAVFDSLVKEGVDEKEAEKRSYGIATKNWIKRYGRPPVRE